MTMIASCKGLQSLELNFSCYAPSSYAYNSNFDNSKVAGFKYVGAAVQGLKVLAFNVPDSPPVQTAAYAKFGHQEMKEKLIKGLNVTLAEHLALERTGKYNINLFRAIQEKVDLDVHGEGRLSKDKKPALVSLMLSHKSPRDMLLGSVC